MLPCWSFHYIDIMSQDSALYFPHRQLHYNPLIQINAHKATEKCYTCGCSCCPAHIMRYFYQKTHNKVVCTMSKGANSRNDSVEKSRLKIYSGVVQCVENRTLQSKQKKPFKLEIFILLCFTVSNYQGPTNTGFLGLMLIPVIGSKKF